MAATPIGTPCAAHNCLKQRYKEGWCAAHWYAHKARLLQQIEAEHKPDSLAMQIEAEDKPESLVICEAIWDASRS